MDREVRRVLRFKEYFLLNALCKSYHSGFGYHLDEQCLDKDIAGSPLLLAEYVKYKGESLTEEQDDYVWINIEAAESLAKETKLTHSKIIIRLDYIGIESGWIKYPSKVRSTWWDDDVVVDSPVDWYELPERLIKCRSGLSSLLGPISDMKYIEVTHPYDQVEINAKLKGNLITIDDILFASRALCKDPTRGPDGYSVLSDDGLTLILKANIDNFST